jgi:hypothetical protein
MKPALVSILAAAMLLELHAQSADRLLLGVMRRDGVIVPFAFFDGDWSAPWPAGIHNLDLPVTLAGVPKKWWGGEPPTSWAFFPTGTKESVSVTPLAPAVVMAGRQRRLGLRTGVTSSQPLPNPYELPFPKEGLVATGGAQVEPIATVSNLTGAWKELITVLEADILSAEQKTVEKLRSDTGWTHPFAREQRRAMRPELESWYTSTLEQPGFTLSYIEAVKKYPPQPEDESCGLETFIRGWVHGNTRTKQPRTELVAKITYCDRQGVSYMLPLGLLRLKNRTHWVFQTSSWENEWYVVVEATPGHARYIVEYHGGGR